jgi:hypothetical protein
MNSIDRNHPLWRYFRGSMKHAMSDKVGLSGHDDVEDYLTDMLVAFLHDEAIFAIRDAQGRRVESLAEMLAEGDVRLRAPNFDREREVHRHVGDFLLFWSGLFPEMLPKLRGFHSNSPEDEAVRQGRFSYGVVSSFDHAPYALEAPTFRVLSSDFEACQLSLRLLRASFDGFKLQGWDDGFRA